MIKISSLYDNFKGKVNEHYGGAVAISTFVDWAHDCQLILFNELVSEFQKTQQLSDYITPFLTSINVIVNKNPGGTYDIIKKPEGYENLASARIIRVNDTTCGCKGIPEFDGEEVKNQCGEYLDADDIQILKEQQDENRCEVPIKIVDNDRWGAICNHPRKKISKKNPAITQYSGGFKLAPKNSAISIVMDFFKTPTKPVFSFTVINPNTENEYIQYDDNSSTHLEWSELLMPKFLELLSVKYSTFVGK